MSTDDRVAVTPGIARPHTSPALAGAGRLGLVTNHTGALPDRHPAAPALIGDGDSNSNSNSNSNVYIGVSHSGTTPETVRVLGLGRRSGAIATALTNAAPSPVADAVDAVLITVVRASGPRSGAMPSASPNSPSWTAS
ncbi:MurR/RpiR family transcriptional regulator [Streptomyces avermitilis]|uniref:hypothetical protein n=1 Tax=Streptomyces avermitilis TaxID=33903 RepID=UPI00381FC142